MADQGRWITINGAHVFIKDGEEPGYNKNPQKTVNDKNKRQDGESYGQWKVRITRQFIEQAVKEINAQNKKRFDPEDSDTGISNSDLQGMVEAFVMENGFTDKDDKDILKEIRVRTGLEENPELKAFYEKNARTSKYK